MFDSGRGFAVAFHFHEILEPIKCPHVKRFAVDLVKVGISQVFYHQYAIVSFLNLISFGFIYVKKPLARNRTVNHPQSSK
jgi:hypothetical protein